MHLQRRQLRAGKAVLVGSSGALRQSVHFLKHRLLDEQPLTEQTSNRADGESV